MCILMNSVTNREEMRNAIHVYTCSYIIAFNYTIKEIQSPEKLRTTKKKFVVLQMTCHSRETLFFSLPHYIGLKVGNRSTTTEVCICVDK